MDGDVDRAMGNVTPCDNLPMRGSALFAPYLESGLVNDALGTTSWLFQDVSDVTFIVFTELCVGADSSLYRLTENINSMTSLNSMGSCPLTIQETHNRFYISLINQSKT
jgi:hypothetical protein